MSSQMQRRSQSLSPVPTSRPHVPRRSCSLERALEESFFDDDDDDWIFDPIIDEILNKARKRQYNEAFSDEVEEDIQYGGAIQPMLDCYVLSERVGTGKMCSTNNGTKPGSHNTETPHPRITSVKN